MRYSRGSFPGAQGYVNVGSIETLGRINDQLWIGGERGLLRIHDSHFESIPVLSTLGAVTGLLQARNGDAWLGRYVFRVIAANDDGVWNEKGAAVALVVPPLFYQTLWFRILCAALAVAAITALFFGRCTRSASGNASVSSNAWRTA